MLKHLPTKRQTLFFSATLPYPIVELSREMLKDPALISIERKSAPATGITQSVFPVSQELKTPLLATLLERGEITNAIVFTRTKHRANRLFEQLEKRKVNVARIHGNRSQAQRTEALTGFRNGRYKILVATDIAARGIDVEALSHVVNFDVPKIPDDYIHRVGRTARAEMTGDAITFVSPDEENELRAIERAIGKRLPRVTVPDFDYSHKPVEKLEIPLQDRIAEIRARKSEERARAKANADASRRPARRRSPGPRLAARVRWRPLERPHRRARRPPVRWPRSPARRGRQHRRRARQSERRSAQRLRTRPGAGFAWRRAERQPLRQDPAGTPPGPLNGHLVEVRALRHSEIQGRLLVLLVADPEISERRSALGNAKKSLVSKAGRFPRRLSDAG